MDASFIHDKLEIKFLILYIAARVSEPIPIEGMQELTLCDSGIDYFSFSECLSDLVHTEHLTLSDGGLYAITPKGLRNSEICESSLPLSVRLLTPPRIVFGEVSDFPIPSCFLFCTTVTALRITENHTTLNVRGIGC